MKVFYARIRECVQRSGGTLTALEGLLGVGDVLIELRQLLDCTLELPVQCAQPFFARLDVLRLRRYQAGQNVFDRLRFLSESLQLVLGVKHSRPAVVHRRGRVTAWAFQRDFGRTAEKPVASTCLDLHPYSVVLGQGSSGMHTQTVQERALARHAATDDACEVRCANNL